MGKVCREPQRPLVVTWGTAPCGHPVMKGTSSASERGLSEQPRQEAQATEEAELGLSEAKPWPTPICTHKTVWTRRLIRDICLGVPGPLGFHHQAPVPSHFSLALTTKTTFVTSPYIPALLIHKPSSHCGKHSYTSKGEGSRCPRKPMMHICHHVGTAQTHPTTPTDSVHVSGSQHCSQVRLT